MLMLSIYVKIRVQIKFSAALSSPRVPFMRRQSMVYYAIAP